MLEINSGSETLRRPYCLTTEINDDTIFQSSPSSENCTSVEWIPRSVDLSPETTILKQKSPDCVNVIQRKRKKSKDHHVHFTFDDFHCFSNQDESQVSNIIYQTQKSENGHIESETIHLYNVHSISDSFGYVCDKLPVHKENFYCGFSNRQWAILIIFMFADMCSAILLSLQAPLYPAEAEKKGVSATVFGFVFGIFEFTVFLVSLFCGKYIQKVGATYLYSSGIFITGTCAILFGFLDFIDDRLVFIALCLFIRIVEALGNAAFINSSYTIIVYEFSQSTGITFALKEIFFAIGLILGPTIGGILYQIGGFTFPFLLIGIFQIVVAVLTLIVLPRSSRTNLYLSQPDLSESYSITDILKIPEVMATTLSIFAAAFSTGFLSATLEPHIRQFGPTYVLTGLFFMISTATYAITAPIWGWICDRLMQAKYVSIFGSFLILIGFLMIGPVPIFPFHSTLEISAIGLALHGLGLGAALVSSFRHALKETLKRNFPDNITTYGLITALWTSSFTLGNSFGPIIAGILLDYVGFRSAIWAVMVPQVFVVSLLFVAKLKRLKINHAFKEIPLDDCP